MAPYRFRIVAAIGVMPAMAVEVAVMLWRCTAFDIPELSATGVLVTLAVVIVELAVPGVMADWSRTALVPGNVLKDCPDPIVRLNWSDGATTETVEVVPPRCRLQPVRKRCAQRCRDATVSEPWICRYTVSGPGGSWKNASPAHRPKCTAQFSTGSVALTRFNNGASTGGDRKR